MCNDVASMNSRDQRSVSETTNIKPIIQELFSCSNKRTSETPEGSLHLSPHFPSSSSPHMSLNVLPRQVSPSPAITPCPGRRLNLAIKTASHLCFLHLLCWGGSKARVRPHAGVRACMTCIEGWFWHMPWTSFAAH